MTEAVNKFLWTGPKFMPELHIRQPGFTYSSADHCERNQLFKETDDLHYNYKIKLDKACFAHDVVYADYSNDVAKKTVSEKIELMLYTKSAI